MHPLHDGLELFNRRLEALGLDQRAVHDEVGGAAVNIRLESLIKNVLCLDHITRLRLADDVREVRTETHRAEGGEEGRTAVVPAPAEDADAAWVSAQPLDQHSFSAPTGVGGRLNLQQRGTHQPVPCAASGAEAE